VPAALDPELGLLYSSTGNPGNDAVFLVRRHYAKCLTCTLVNRPVAAETPNVEPNQFHLVLSRAELTAIVSALRVVVQADLAERLDAILRQI